MGKINSHKPLIRKLFISCFVILILINCIGIAADTIRVFDYRKNMPYHQVGVQFEGLSKTLANIDTLGYYTGRRTLEGNDLKLFTQAQYVLAPTIIEFNNLNHEYILFVTNQKIIAKMKIEEIGAIPVQVNPFGMILTRKKQ